MSAYLYDQTSLKKLDEEIAPQMFPQGPLRLEEA